MGSVRSPQLDDNRKLWLDKATALIDAERVRLLIAELVDHHSPTGDEREICLFLEHHLRVAGFDSHCDFVTETSANCIARLAGTGGGPHLLLYAPVDTHLDAEAATDLPWVGPSLRADMLPSAQIDDGAVIGLGAANPKAMVAAIVEAARCVVEAEVPLAGDMMLAFCGGGMPWRPVSRGDVGLSSGVRHMLSGGMSADFGVIVKTWDDIYYEHPGLAWFRVDVTGSLGYAGMRGANDLRNSVVPAAAVILAVEEWLKAYPEAHRSEQVLPQGAISAVHGGWVDRPAFPAAQTRIYLDVRTNPDQTAISIQREFAELIDGLRARFAHVELGWEMIEFCQGARTDPDNWIVGAAKRAWRETRGSPYGAAAPMSGQCDAAALVLGGIPTVRIGFPFGNDERTPVELRDGLGGMGVARVEDLTETIRRLMHIVIDTCTRSRAAIASLAPEKGLRDA